MKKTIYLLLLLPLLVLASCSDDDDDWGSVTEQSIVGRWQMSSARVKSVNTNNPEITAALKDTALNGTPMIEFQEGGRYIDEDGRIGTYSLLDGNTIYISVGSLSTVYENVVMGGNTLRMDVDIKDETQKGIDAQYPNSNIIIYDLVMEVTSVRR